jgi:hypothetical protein
MYCNYGFFAYLSLFFVICIFVTVGLISINFIFRAYKPKLLYPVFLSFGLIFVFVCFNLISNSQKLVTKLDQQLCAKLNPIG